MPEISNCAVIGFVSCPDDLCLTCNGTGVQDELCCNCDDCFDDILGWSIGIQIKSPSAQKAREYVQGVRCK